MLLKFNSLARAAALFVASTIPLMATAADAPASSQQNDSSSIDSNGNFFRDWFASVSRIQSEQPRWITPVVTVTPRLEQELRYDQMWQRLPGGHTLDIYGGGKGLELIPAENIEVILGVPAWETEDTSPRKEGWTDETFLLKYRLLSANAENGNYIVTAFLGLSVPTGSEAITTHHYVVTPTIAFGKGWGNFDFQSTLGVSIPDNGSAPTGAGTPLVWNTALQYRVIKYFWPEVELNYTYWPNGKRDNLTQAFITPGVVIGRIPIASRLGLTFGAGYQVAVTDDPLYRQNFIFTARLPF